MVEQNGESHQDPFGAEDDALETRSAGRLVGQIVLLAVAVLLFLWLINVLSDDPVWPDAVDGIARGGWIAILLILLVIDLVAVILLLRPVMVERLLSGASPFDDDPLYMVGCKACGTTFDRRHHEIDEPHEKRFACPNCNRIGELRTMRKRKGHVEDHWCNNCDKHYKIYQDHSECPHCHAAQEHPLN